MACIMVVDDEIDVRLTLREALELHGYSVIEASNGNAALSLYRKEQPDLLILDLFMPEKEGLEVILELKREYPDAKIIAISGGGTLGLKEGALRAAQYFGAQRGFTKPFALRDVLDAVEALLKT